MKRTLVMARAGHPSKGYTKGVRTGFLGFRYGGGNRPADAPNRVKVTPVNVAPTVVVLTPYEGPVVMEAQPLPVMDNIQVEGVAEHVSIAKTDAVYTETFVPPTENAGA